MKHSPLMLLAERASKAIYLTSAASGAQKSQEIEQGIRTLENWDNAVAAGSRGGPLCAIWWERSWAKGLGKFAVAWSAADPTTTPRGLADRQRAVKTFLAAMREVNKLYGRPDIAWGEVHRIRKGNVDLGVGGGDGKMGCFRVLEFRKDRDGKLAANRGDSWVFAVEFTQPPKAYTVVAYSQSDVAGTPHFSGIKPRCSRPEN